MPHTIMSTLKLVVELIQVILPHTSRYCLFLSFMLAKSIGFNSEVLDFIACLSCRLSPVALDSNPF